jgi:hypothetical protein
MVRNRVLTPNWPGCYHSVFCVGAVREDPAKLVSEGAVEVELD